MRTLIANKIQYHLKNYLIQSLFAAIAVFIILFAFNLYTNPVIVAGMGSTVFAAFAMPKSVTASTKNILGGHSLGILTGAGFNLLYFSDFLRAWPTAQLVVVALSISLSIFLMVFFDFEHPPASGIAMGITISPLAWQPVVFILGFSAALCFIKWLLRSWLIDLV